MKKENYLNSCLYNELLNSIKKAINKKKQIKLNYTLTPKNEAEIMSQLSDHITDGQIKKSIFIHKNHFREFENGTEITINPERKEVKLAFNKDDSRNDYEEIFAYSFGPFNPYKYFLSPKKIIIVDWEPFMLVGELEKYRAGEILQLGGHLQAKEFPTYDKLEANTHRIAVDFCKHLMSKFSVDKTKDEIMQDHMCILEHNFFPALAFTNNCSSNQSHMKKFSEWNKDILSFLLDFYEGDIIIGHRDFMGHICSYGGMFNAALWKDNPDSEGESTEILLQGRHNATIIGRRIIRSWFNHNLGGKGASAILDEKGKLWIGYVHFQSRRGDQWSLDDQEELASWIHRLFAKL